MNIKVSLVAFICLVSSGNADVSSHRAIERTDDAFKEIASVVSENSETAVRVGTWNVKRFGNGSKRYDLVAKVIEENTDVVSLQEIMNPESVIKLMDLLPGWTYRISHSVGRSGYFEHYAILIRKSVGSFTESQTINDPGDNWAREPFLACVDVHKSEMCLLSIHVIYGDSTKERDDEIRSLLARAALIKRMNPTRGLIVLGDFNRSGNSSAFISILGKEFSMADTGTMKTTLGSRSYVNPYDHILVDGGLILRTQGDAFMFDIVENVCNRDFKWCLKNVSDHAPVILHLGL